MSNMFALFLFNKLPITQTRSLLVNDVFWTVIAFSYGMFRSSPYIRSSIGFKIWNIFIVLNVVLDVLKLMLIFLRVLLVVLSLVLISIISIITMVLILFPVTNVVGHPVWIILNAIIAILSFVQNAATNKEACLKEKLRQSGT